MNVQQKLELNRRIISLKLTSRIAHKPKPILDRGFFTANEYRSLLFYYLRFSLYGLLNKELIAHFTLLSDSIYMLCKSQITKNEVLIAGSMLEKFADQFELYYGKNSVTINVHLLRHYAQSVLNTGLLWCQSAFPYESNIGELKRSFNCTVDVMEQIAFNYSIKAESAGNISDDYEETPKILRLKKQALTLKQAEMLNATSAESIKGTDQHQIGYEMRWGKTVFKSTASVITKSIDYFVQLTDGTIGCIEYFIMQQKAHVIVREYEKIKFFGHLIQVKSTDKYKIHACDTIVQKLIYLKFNFSNVSCIEIVTNEPNLIECN